MPVDYMQFFGGMPKILIIDDDDSLRRSYINGLETAGFEVYELNDGLGLANMLNLASKMQGEFDVVLSDTEMTFMDGPEAVEAALASGILNRDKTLILGMSEVYDNKEKWRGIAHHLGFFEKPQLKEIGRTVISHLYNFRSSGGIWKEIMK